MHEYCMSGSSQDSLVVCRLRKNVEFRLNDATSRPSLTQSNFSRARDGSNTASGSDADRMRASQMHMAAEFSKKSVSNESYSMEQFDSASENEQKQSNEISLAESSSRQKDSDNEEDFYADILKDDIVKLDETPFFAATSGFLPVAVSNTAIVSNPQQPVESMVSQAFPLQTIPIQGTTTRIIKLKRRMASAPLAQGAKSGAKEHPAEENNARRPEEQPKCVIDLLSIRPWLIPVVSVAVLLLVVLLLYLFGGPQQVIRRIAYATLYKASLFWH